MQILNKRNNMDIKTKIISVLDREIEEANKEISELGAACKSANAEDYCDIEDETEFWGRHKNKIIGIKTEMEEFFKEAEAELDFSPACGLNIPEGADQEDACVAHIAQKVSEEMSSPSCTAKEATRQTICEIVRKQACIPDSDILNCSCDLKDTYALESLEMIELIYKVEEEYGINIASRDAAKLVSIDDIVGYVNSYLQVLRKQCAK
jgi:acyl carrier protein